MDTDQIAVITRDPRIVDLVESAAAAVGAKVARYRDASTLGTPPRLVIIGADVASELVGVSWPGSRFVVAGFDADQAARSSLALGAQVAVLPEAAGALATLIAGKDAARHGRVIACVGGSGGAGTSTLAVGLATSLASRGCVALVDADPISGGLDLFLGAERAQGWRWPMLRGASGRVGELGNDLVRAEGIAVLAAARPWQPPVPGAAVAAAMQALVRQHDVVVVDAGRGFSELAQAALAGADEVCLVVDASFGSIAAAKSAVGRLSRLTRVVVRRDRGCALQTRDVALGLGVQCVHEVPWDKELGLGLERGIPPLHAAGPRWRGALAELAATMAGAHV